MFGTNRPDGGKVCNGARHLENASVGPGAQAKPLNNRFQKLLARRVQRTMLSDKAHGHLGVAMRPRQAPKALPLRLARRDHPFPNRRRRFGFSAMRERVERHGKHFEMQIDAVHERAANLSDVSLNLGRRTRTVSVQAVLHPARTGVHARDKHEPGRIGHRAARPADRYFPFFKRLPQHFEGLPLEFRQLVQKQDPVVRQRNLSRHGVAAAAAEPGVRNGVMRRPKRTARYHALLAQQASHRMNLRRFKGFFLAQRRQDGGDSARQHGLAGARRPHHHGIVSARRGYFQRPLHILLSPHVRKVAIRQRGFPNQRPSVSAKWRRRAGRLLQKSMAFADIRHGKHLHIADQRSLPCVAGRHHHRRHAFFSGAHHHGQHAPNRAYVAVQRQFSDNACTRQRFAARVWHVRRQQPHRDREVERGAFFPEVGGGQVDGDFAVRQRNARILKCGIDAVAALPNGSVRQANYGVTGQARGNAGFNLDGKGVYAAGGGAPNVRKHRDGSRLVKHTTNLPIDPKNAQT